VLRARATGRGRHGPEHALHYVAELGGRSRSGDWQRWRDLSIPTSGAVLTGRHPCRVRSGL